MSKIATENEAYIIGRKGTPVNNKCCTKHRAIELGCNITSGYSDNQLVQQEDLSHSVLRCMGMLFDNMMYQYGAVITIPNFSPYSQYEAMISSSFDVKMIWVSSYGNCNPVDFWTNKDTIILTFEDVAESAWQFQIDTTEPGQEDLKFDTPNTNTLMFAFR